MSSSPEITRVGTAISSRRSGRLGVEPDLGLPDLVRPADGEVEGAPLHQAYGVADGGRDHVGSAVRTVDPGPHVGLRRGVQVARLDRRASRPSRSRSAPRSSRSAGRHPGRPAPARPPGRAFPAPPRRRPRPRRSHPTTWARSMPRPSRVASTSARGDQGPDGSTVDSPYPRRSRRTHVAGGGQGRPHGVPHPPVGDAGVQEQDRGGAGGSGAVVGDGGLGADGQAVSSRGC